MVTMVSAQDYCHHCGPGIKDIFLKSHLIECYECCWETGRDTEHEEQKLLVGTPFAYMNQHLKIQKYYSVSLTDSSNLV